MYILRIALKLQCLRLHRYLLKLMMKNSWVFIICINNLSEKICIWLQNTEPIIYMYVANYPYFTVFFSKYEIPLHNVMLIKTTAM